jgi:zona occludens toxin (predicted ATPase)
MDGMLNLVVDETVTIFYPNANTISARADESYVASERAFDWQNPWRHHSYSMATSCKSMVQQISPKRSCHRRSWWLLKI